jgi:hypothetical protein
MICSKKMKQHYWFNRILFLFSAFVFSLVCSKPSAAQDSQYWNLQYGTKATLLGGAVIGSVSDLSATYYNPGAVSLFENPKLIISAKVYEFERYRIENGAGENRDLINDRFSMAPNFFAFKIGRDTTSRNKLAVSILTRNYMNLNFNTRNISEKADANGDTSVYSGLFTGYEYLNEMWGGLTFSHKFNEMIGLGVTGYGIYRYQTIQRQLTIDELQPNNSIHSYANKRGFNYTNYRALIKAGLGIKLNPVTLGLTITSPSLSVLGSGGFGYCKVINDPDSASNNVYQSNYQDTLKATYRSSWAIGLGAAYWHKRYNLHISAEWYNAVRSYQPMTIKDFKAQSNGETVHNEIRHNFKSVINFGIGGVYTINNSTDISGGITTDFSANQGNAQYNIALTNWNIYHVNAGSNFKLGRAEITLGLSYSFGKNVINQQLDLYDQQPVQSDVKPELDTRFKRIKLLFGFIF